MSNRTKVLTAISMIRLYRMSTIHLSKPQLAKSKMTDLYVKALKLNQSQYLDKIYGVRNVNNKFFIGNLPISFYTNKIKVNGVAYPKTMGLFELLS